MKDDELRDRTGTQDTVDVAEADEADAPEHASGTERAAGQARQLWQDLKGESGSQSSHHSER